jgi:hypothetical protein
LAVPETGEFSLYLAGMPSQTAILRRAHHTFLPLLTILLCHRLQAQPVARDSSAANSGYASALALYHNFLVPETGLYKGNEYADYAHLLRDGHPFYGEYKFKIGTVTYHGILYQHVPILYDLVFDEVVIGDYDHIFKIILTTPLVDRFTIEDHSFIHLKDSVTPGMPKVGFYEVLYSGHITLLKKETKTVQEDLSNGDHAQRFIDGTDSSYLLKMGNVYYPVNHNNSLLATLKDKKKELRRFIRSNNLSMRKDREDTLIKVAAWYDSSPH